MKHKWTIILSLVLTFSLCCSSLPVSAAAGACYTIGGYPFVESEIQQLAYYWGRMGYSSWYTIEQGSSYITSTRLNSPVVAFYAHGSSGSMTIRETASSTPYYLTTGLSTSDGVEIGLSSFSLSSTGLMVFGGCETGAGSYNLVVKAILQGASSAIGWEESVSKDDLNMWVPRFQYRLYQGYSVEAAVNHANSFTDYYENAIVKAVNVQGGSTTIPHYGSAASLSEMTEAANADCLREYTVNYPLGDDVEQSLIDSIAAVTGIQLATGGYTLQESSVEGEGISAYCLQIKRGDFEANTGFVVTVKDGVILHIAHTTADNDGAVTMSAAPTVTEADRAAAVAQANAEVATDFPDATIVEQRGKNYYDANTDTYYYIINSIYQFEDGTKGGHITSYVID